MNSYLPAWTNIPDFEGAPISYAFWERSEQAFEVTFCYDRVYFRLQDKPERTYASLDICSPSEIELCFQSVLRSGDFGFYYINNTVTLSPSKHGNGWHIGSGSGPHFRLHAICHISGVGWIREWSSPDWIWFDPIETRIFAFAPDYLYQLHKPHMLEWFYRVLKQKGDELFFRDVGDAEFNGIVERWINGDESEFSHVIPLAVKSGLFRDPNHWVDSPIILHYNENVRASELRAYGGAKFFGHPDFLKLLNRRLKIGGYNWYKSDFGQQRYRKFFSMFPRSRCLFHIKPAQRSYLIPDETFTFHEQIEGAIELRNYLESIAEEENLTEEELELWCRPKAE